IVREWKSHAQPPGPAPGQSEIRWVEDLVVWLATVVLREQTGWVVLDGFDHPDVPQLTHDLIAELAKRASQRTEQLGLVLLDY
ncbi:hypothetical protein OVW19_30320, partial [Klebsiella pneumoniae]|uniref:hypothetical protein n=1 Tax=Klebsiella pneumoniae TaxID=573 RepID=UPI00226D86EB